MNCIRPKLQKNALVYQEPTHYHVCFLRMFSKNLSYVTILFPWPELIRLSDEVLVYIITESVILPVFYLCFVYISFNWRRIRIVSRKWLGIPARNIRQFIVLIFPLPSSNLHFVVCCVVLSDFRYEFVWFCLRKKKMKHKQRELLQKSLWNINDRIAGTCSKFAVLGIDFYLNIFRI